MFEHGDFEVHVKAPVVYGIPISAFNAEGTQAYYDAVYKAAEGLDQWILFENPQASAALTQEAMNCVLRNYHTLSASGCVGISLQISNVIARILRSQDLTKLDIPFKASTNQIELGKFVEGLVNEIESTEHNAKAG